MCLSIGTRTRQKNPDTNDFVRIFTVNCINPGCISVFFKIQLTKLQKLSSSSMVEKCCLRVSLLHANEYFHMPYIFFFLLTFFCNNNTFIKIRYVSGLQIDFSNPEKRMEKIYNVIYRIDNFGQPLSLTYSAMRRLLKLYVIMK